VRQRRAVLAVVLLLAACDSPTRPLGSDRASGIHKQFCYFDPCLTSLYTAASYVAGVRVTDLGTLSGDVNSYATDVNDAGQITGASEDVNFTPRAVLWFPPSQTTAQALVTLGGSSSVGTGINAKGTITGWSTTPAGQQDGFVWNFGLQQHLTFSNPQNLSYQIYPARLNDSGTVAGWVLVAAGAQMAYWPSGTSVAQTPAIAPVGHVSSVDDINNTGTMVGSFENSSFVDTAFSWQTGQSSATAFCPSQANACYAFGVSDNGQIAGSAYYNMNQYLHAFVQDQTGIHDLGNLWPGHPTQSSSAHDIDNEDLAVGWSNDSTSLGAGTGAFLWGADFGMYALPNLPGAVMNASQARGMNGNLLGDSILIVGQAAAAKSTSVTHAVLWSVTLGLKPVFTVWPGVWGRPFTPIIYENPGYVSGSAPDRYIEVKIAGGGNLDPNTIDLTSLQLNGTKPVYTSIKDLNGDGYQDLLMLFSMKQLMTSGSLTARTIQLVVTGSLQKIGAPLLDITPVTICLSARSCPTDDTVTGPT